MRKINKEEVRDFLKTCDTNTKIYFGCDSARFRIKGQWYAEYTSVVVVHINGNKGCKIFGEIEREKDYTHNAKKPSMRLLNEVYKVADLYKRLEDVVGMYPVEIHLDINSDDRFASNRVLNQATGYIKGMCNVVPLVKPDALASSFGADRFKSIIPNETSA